MFRLLLALIIGAAFAAAVILQDRADAAPSAQHIRKPYRPYYSSFFLPGFLAMVLLIGIVFLGIAETVRRLAPGFLSVVLSILLYDTLLLFLLPLLRRYVSARLCAALWIMPNALYFLFTYFPPAPQPLLVLPLPAGILPAAVWIWAAGFLVVMLWKLSSHLLLCRRLLRGAQPLHSGPVNAAWKQLQLEIGYSGSNIPIIVSSAASTPLSIGLSRKTTKLILPRQEYEPQELSLILRHELIHILRCDSATKLFMVFCTALTWFNPLSWIAVKRCSDDLELSCDESVLLGASSETRRLYADLLLRTAGDDRGFTTCLSASAQAMRYRLKNVMTPKKRYVGGILAGVILTAFMLSCGSITLSYDPGTWQTHIFGAYDLSDSDVVQINLRNDYDFDHYSCSDTEALNQMLAAIPLQRVAGTYDLPSESFQAGIVYSFPSGTLFLGLTDRYVHAALVSGGREYSSLFLLDTVTDWSALHAFTA